MLVVFIYGTTCYKLFFWDNTTVIHLQKIKLGNFTLTVGLAMAPLPPGQSHFSSFYSSPLLRQKLCSLIFLNKEYSLLFLKRECSLLFLKREYSLLFLKREYSLLFLKREYSLIFLKREYSLIFLKREYLLLLFFKMDCSFFPHSLLATFTIQLLYSK